MMERMLPLEYWGEVVDAAIYISNVVALAVMSTLPMAMHLGRSSVYLSGVYHGGKVIT